MVRNSSEDESAPLLRSTSPPEPTTATNTTNRRSGAWHFLLTHRAVIAPGLSMLLMMNFALQMLRVSLPAVIEYAVCAQHHPDLPPLVGGGGESWRRAAADPRCKGEDVQAALGIVTAQEETATMVPTMLLVVPYAVMARRVGVRWVLGLVWLGCVVQQGFELLICVKPHVFDIRWIYLASSLGGIIGGGVTSLNAMRSVVAGSISTDANRAVVFFYMGAIPILATLLGGPVAYFIYERHGPVVTHITHLVLIASNMLITAFLPDIAAPPEKDAEDRRRDEGDVEEAGGHGPSKAVFWREILSGIRSSFVESYSMLKKLFGTSAALTLLMCSFMFVELGMWETVFRNQYATKRYGWTWGETGLLASLRATVNILSLAVFLPALHHLLSSRLGLSPVRKDLWLARGLILGAVAGSVLCGLAPTSGPFLVGVVVFEACPGIMAVLLSLMASVVADPAMHDAVYVGGALLWSLGGLVAPLMARVFALGLRMGEPWYGLPFLVGGGLQAISLLIVMFPQIKIE